MNIEIENITEAQAIAIEEFLRQWVYLGNVGSSRWTCFYADGDGNFRPKIKVNGKDAQFADKEIISKEMREEMWESGEFRIDFDMIAGRLKK